jgi:hypothetical protein
MNPFDVGHLRRYSRDSPEPVPVGLLLQALVKRPEALRILGALAVDDMTKEPIIEKDACRYRYAC